MNEGYYTLALWKVRPGMEDEFLSAWRAMADVFMNLPRPATQGTLIQSISDPTIFYSFGPWKNIDEVEAMRTDPEAQAAVQRVVDLCEEATPGTYQVVAEINT